MAFVIESGVKEHDRMQFRTKKEAKAYLMANLSTHWSLVYHEYYLFKCWHLVNFLHETCLLQDGSIKRFTKTPWRVGVFDHSNNERVYEFYDRAEAFSFIDSLKCSVDDLLKNAQKIDRCVIYDAGQEATAFFSISVLARDLQCLI